MFKDTEAFSSFSVDDIEAAKAFYGDKLGLEVTDTPMGFIDLKLGGGQRVLVYTKSNHQPATFTVMNFVVSDIEKAVDDLSAVGIRMEQYNTEEFKTDAKGIARDDRGVPGIAWFTDPAGNVIAVMELP